MKDYEGFFKMRDGLDFFERRWEPTDDARVNLVLIHGYGEHCSRYSEVGRTFNAHGIAVHTFDQRGYGRSPGKRAYIDDFDVLLDDMDCYLDHIRPLLAGKPWFIMGHSMGGLVLANYVETRKVDARGLVFCSPFLGFSDDIPKYLIALADILGTVAPWLPVNNVDNTKLSRDPKIVEAANNDPLGFHGRCKARTGAQFNRAITRARAGYGTITLPMYVIHGSSDQIVPPSGSRLLYEQAGSKDKTYKLYEGGYHELWNDLEKEAVLRGIAEWVLSKA